jgi:hypothetical protein
LLRDFNAKVGREDILKASTGNESLHKSNNNTGVTVVHFATSKNPTVNSTMFVYHSIHKFTSICPDRKMQTPVSSTFNSLGDLGCGLMSTVHTAGQCGYIISIDISKDTGLNTIYTMSL